MANVDTTPAVVVELLAAGRTTAEMYDAGWEQDPLGQWCAREPQATKDISTHEPVAPGGKWWNLPMAAGMWADDAAEFESDGW
jgi:hypothetical protein